MSSIYRLMFFGFFYSRPREKIESVKSYLLIATDLFYFLSTYAEISTFRAS